jgi:hypothetical protein
LRQNNRLKSLLVAAVAQLLTLAIPMFTQGAFHRLHRPFSTIFKVRSIFSGMMVFAGIGKKPQNVSKNNKVFGVIRNLETTLSIQILTFFLLRQPDVCRCGTGR